MYIPVSHEDPHSDTVPAVSYHPHAAYMDLLYGTDIAIEADVKEREREHERLRECESSGSSFDASPARALSAVNTPGSAGMSSPTLAILMGTTSSPPTIGPAVSSIVALVPLSVPLSPGVDPSPQQPFYP